jgi:hypothetical protein
MRRFIGEVDKLGVHVSRVHTDALLTVIMFDYQHGCTSTPWRCECCEQVRPVHDGVRAASHVCVPHLS